MDKRVGLFGLFILMAFLTTACSNGEAPPPPPAPTTAPPSGLSLVRSNACVACHSIDGTTLAGPTWKGLYGKEESLADGTTVKVDDAYLRESILNPNAKIVKGFLRGIMPVGFARTLSEDEVQAIIDYIKTVK